MSCQCLDMSSFGLLREAGAMRQITTDGTRWLELGLGLRVRVRVKVNLRLGLGLGLGLDDLG